MQHKADVNNIKSKAALHNDSSNQLVKWTPILVNLSWSNNCKCDFAQKNLVHELKFNYSNY